MSADPTGLGVGVYRDTIVVAALTGGGEARIPVQFTVHPCVIQALTIDSELFGSLGSLDCAAPHRDSTFADLFRFLGSAGDSVSIELASDKFAPYLILDTTATPPAAAGVPLLERSGCAGLPGTTCLRYQLLPRSGAFVLEAATVARYDSGSYTLRLFRPRAPHAPASLEQLRADSVTAVATGGVSAEPAVVLRGVVSDPDAGDSLRLEVELRPVGEAFTGAATVVGAPVAANEKALVRVAGLTDNTGYHWRARTLDQTGRVGAWTSFGANAEVDPDFLVAVPDPPAAPAGLGQFKSDAVTAIAVGGPTDEATVVFKGTVFDPDPGDSVRLEVEVRPLGTAFTGEPTASSLLGTSVSIAAVTVVGLADQTDYHWQARAVDRGGHAGTWSSYGGNTEAEADFRTAVAHAPAAPESLTQLRIDGATVIGAGDTIPERSLYFRARLTDPDPGDQLRLEVELKPVGVDFTNIASGSSVPVTSGSTTTVALTGLADNTFYHWQARAVDQTGRAGPWTAFGENLETSPDFYIRVPPTLLVFTVQPTNVVSNGAIAPAVRVSAQDGNGATLTSFAGQVTISLGSGPTGAVLSGTTAVAAAAGVATFSDLRINRSGSGYTLVATSPGLAPVTSSSFVVTASPAAKLTITTPPGTTAQNGVPLSPQPVVQIQDADGNNVSQGGTVITAAIASGDGTLGGTLTLNTNSSGVASFTDLKITGVVGTRTLRFTSPGLTDVTSSAINLTAGPASTVDVNAGNGQSAAAGTAVAVAPSVIVRDASGNPVSGVAVTFVTPGTSNGSVTGGSQTTNAAGVAQVGAWTLGTVAGTDSLQATTSPVLSGSPVYFTATVTPGPPATITKFSGDNLTGQVSTALQTPHVVLIADAHGNPVPGVSITWAAATGGGSVQPLVATTDRNGLASTVRTLGPGAGTQTTTATATLAGGSSTVTFNVNATVGGATQMTIESGDAQVDTVGQTLPVALAVRVTDEFNNPVVGVPIGWTVTDGGGTVNPPSSTTNASGIATTSWTLGTVMTPTDSTQLVQATGTGFPLTFTAFTVPGPVNRNQTSVVASPGTITASTGSSTSTITVTVRDQYGNVIKGKTATLTASGTANTLTQPTTPTDVNGVTTGTLRSTKAEAKTVSARVNTVLMAQTAVVTVTPAAVSPVLSTVTATSPITAGAGVSTITATALDEFSNPIPGATVVLAATGTGNTLTQPAAPTNASGAATGTLSSTVAESKTVSARINDVAISQTATVAVTSGGATKLVLVTEPAAVAQSGVPLATQPVVRLRDAQDNDVSEGGVVVMAAVVTGPTGATLTMATATTDLNGVASFSALAINGLTGIYTLSLGAGSLTPAITAPIALTAGPAAKLAIATQPPASAQNAILFAQQPTVQLQDAAGNPVSQSGTPVAAVIASGGGVLGGTLSVATDAGGLATFTNLTITGVVGPRTLGFSAPALAGATSGTVSLVAGVPTQIAVNGGNHQAAMVQTTVAVPPSVIVRDLSGNPVGAVPVTFAVTGTSNGSRTGGSQTTNASGIAQVDSWTLSAVAKPDTMTATSDGLSGSPVTFVDTARVGAATSLVKFSGDNLSGEVGTTLATPHDVLITDVNGNPVGGVTVTWAAAVGGGSVTPATSVTNAAGHATTVRTLGLNSGVQTTTATSTLAGGPTTVTFSVNATVGGATQMTIEAGNNQVDTVGQTLPVPLSVRVADQFNNPVQGVVISWAVLDGNGSVGPLSSTTNASGIATTSWTLGTITTPTDSIQLVQATGVGSPLTFTAFTVPGPVNGTQTSVVASPGTITASTGSSTSTITVTVRDQYGNVIKGKTVTLTASGTANTLTQPTTPTDVNGVTTGTLSSTKAEPKTVSALATAVPISQTASVTVAPAPVSTSRSTITATSPITASTGSSASTITVTARDEFSNPIPGAPVLLTASGTGNTLTQPAGPTTASGVATGSLSSTVTESKTIGATITGVTIAQTAAVMVNPGGVSLALSTVIATSPITAGSGTSTITVTARDAQGNPIPGATVTLAATGTGNTLTGPAAPTDANGVATGTLSSTVAETKTVSAQVNGQLVTQTAAVVVAPAAVSATLSTVAATSPINAGSGTSTITVTARDQFSNPIPGATVVLAATGTGNTLTQPAGLTNASGVAAGTLVSSVAGSKTVSATINSVAVAQTATVVVSSGTATQLVITTGPPATAQSGVTFVTQPAVRLRDSQDNDVHESGVVVTATVATGPGAA
ncbi:MAG TPA: Ig-like domain-containing protein, partial [Gemmatimonadales bacterium]|nr:Ig-like domain-containing protein [Gemmatimonadales bacterium]